MTTCHDNGVRVHDNAVRKPFGQTVLVTHSSHFVRARDGHVYAPNTLVARDYWSRYRAVFARVLVVARVRPVDEVPEDALRADGDGVAFCDLPDYTDQYVSNISLLLRCYNVANAEKRAIWPPAVGIALMETHSTTAQLAGRPQLTFNAQRKGSESE